MHRRVYLRDSLLTNAARNSFPRRHKRERQDLSNRRRLSEEEGGEEEEEEEEEEEVEEDEKEL